MMLQRRAFMSTVSASNIKHLGPIANSIQAKLSKALNPTRLDIIDDSSKHAGHTAMIGKTPNETHFTVEVVSEAFEGKNLVSRHRMIYALLDEELKNGLHALSLKTKTPTEITKTTTTSSTSS